MTDTIYKEFYYPIIINARNRQNETLTLTFQSYDERVAKLILELQTENDTVLPLDGATVRFYLTFEMNGEQKSREVIGAVESIADQTISLAFPDDLKDFVGTITAGVYIDFNNGQKMDVRNLIFSVERSLIDTGDYGEVPDHYFESFQAVLTDVTNHGTTSKSSMDDKVSEVSAYADAKKSSMDSEVSEVNTYATTRKSAIDGIVSDVQTTGDSAKTQIGQVLPDVQSKVAAINTELAKIDENMPDLFVAYADSADGSAGFSLTDTSKMYKGYGVKNSNLPADYRWEKNVDSLQVGGRNLLKDTANFGSNGRPNGSKDGWLTSYDSTIETEKYNDLTIRSLKNVTSMKSVCDYYFTDFNLGDTYTFSFWAKGTINAFRCYFYGDNGYVGVVDTIGSNGNKSYGRDGACAFNGQNISSEWRRLWVTWKLAATGDINIAKRVVIRTDDATGGDLYVCGVKLEKGNTPTDWSPAPEDQQSQIDNIQVGGRNYLSKKVTKGSSNTTINADSSVTIDLSQNIDTYFWFYQTRNLEFLVGKTVTFSFDSDRTVDINFGFPESRYNNIRNIKAGRNSYTFKFPEGVSPSNLVNSVLHNIGEHTSTGALTLSNFKLELGTLATDSGLSQEELILNSNPVNSILTTLSQENPSTILGGSWNQIGSESKFNQTIYYWQRTQ